MRVRMFAGKPVEIDGHTYSADQGSCVVDVPANDIARILVNNGWSAIALTGPTSERPTATSDPFVATRSAPFFDTTLKELIVFDGESWRSPATGAEV